MGTIYEEQQRPMIGDLKVTVHSTSTIVPAEPTPHRTMFLCNIDQVLNFYVQTIHFFGPHPDHPHPHEAVVGKLEAALSSLLVHYDFLAGRVAVDPGSGRLVFDCNSKGIGLVVAASEYGLDDVGDLVYPNPAFEQLVPKDFFPEDKPLIIFQVTSFKCGGFAIGVECNHAAFDGLSFKMFLDNLGAVTAGKPLLHVPCHDRDLLAARFPPKVTFPHHELKAIDHILGSQLESIAPPVFENTEEYLDFKIFRLTGDDIGRLKCRAEDGGAKRPSGFNTVTAHIWRCKALSVAGEDEERLSTLLFAVDIRPRLSPPLPRSYAGNAVLTAYATASCRDLRAGPLSRLVEMVKEGAARMTDEYARSAIDWGQLHRGFPHGEFMVSSWWRLGFADVEYPWGQPRYSCPLVYHRKEVILLFPDMDVAGAGKNDSVNVIVALPADEMAKFQTLFYEFLKESE
ncbi:hypothetical protein SAY86_020236 [Trapa natans]|uniref:Omega-hydroxypalmitate O-feruloyl transferase n=1 Tax=Trapa natans TaxID=22666 RepID=A0AAN7LZ11_TRANT|nr:hypothetical protein SAY86_020236 [Trapa natans]